MPRSNGNPESRSQEGRRLRRLLQAAIAALIVVDAVFFLLLLKPAEERAREQREGFEKLSADLQSRRQTIESLRKIASSVGEAQKQDAIFYQQKFLPRPTGFSTIMEELEKLAKENRVNKGGVSYALSELRNRPELNQVDITTTLEGDYGDIVRFINRLERSKLFLIIDTIAVGGGGATAQSPQPRLVRLSLRLVTFFRV